MTQTDVDLHIPVTLLAKFMSMCDILNRLDGTLSLQSLSYMQVRSLAYKTAQERGRLC